MSQKEQMIQIGMISPRVTNVKTVLRVRRETRRAKEVADDFENVQFNMAIFFFSPLITRRSYRHDPPGAQSHVIARGLINSNRVL